MYHQERWCSPPKADLVIGAGCMDTPRMMDRSDLHELHYIALIENLPSICVHGILSHKRAGRVQHGDIASETIQERRRGKRVPDARRQQPRLLHEYANLYICGHNPMLYILQGQHQELAVLRVSSAVLDLDGVVLADGNAASEYTRYYEPEPGLAAIDREIVFAGDPTHPDRYEFYSRKRRMMAEVLVPDVVPPSYIDGIYVSCNAARTECRRLGVSHPVTVDPTFFYL